MADSAKPREVEEETKENLNLVNRRMTVSRLEPFQKPPKELEERPKVHPLKEQSPQTTDRRSYLDSPQYKDPHPVQEHDAVRHFIKNIADENDRLHRQSKKALVGNQQDLAVNHMLLGVEVLRLVEVVSHYENSVKGLTTDLEALEKEAIAKGKVVITETKL